MSCLVIYVVQERAQSIFSSPITSGMKSTDSSLYDDHCPGKQLDLCKERVEFILIQLEFLEHYLPETYQMLMDELDQQHKQLKILELKGFYYRQSNAEQDKTTDSRNQEQGQEPIDHPT